MALEEEIITESQAESTDIQAWLEAKASEVKGYITLGANDRAVEQNTALLLRIETVQNADRTPEEQALGERFLEVEALARGLVDVDLLPSVDEQLKVLKTDFETTEAAVKESERLSPTSLFASVLHERLVSITTDLQVRIRHLEKDRLRAAENPNDAATFLTSIVPRK